MVAAFVYKMDRSWLRPDERVEIHWGHALWVTGRRGDETVKVNLQRNHPDEGEQGRGFHER